MLTESSMNRISQISRLDHRGLFRYGLRMSGSRKSKNERIQLLNEWMFDIYDESKGIQRLLALCSERMDGITDANQFCVATRNIVQSLDVLYSLLSLHRNNAKVFAPDSGGLDVRSFISFVGTLINKTLKIHQTIMDTLNTLNMMTMDQMNTLSLRFDQIMDSLQKLMQIPFLSQPAILRRHIEVQCKVVFHRQIMCLFTKICESTNQRNWDILGAFWSTNFHSMLKLHAAIRAQGSGHLFQVTWKTFNYPMSSLFVNSYVVQHATANSQVTRSNSSTLGLQNQSKLPSKQKS